MKKVILILVMKIFSFTVIGQSHEVKQLLLNWQKLTQFKQMLKDMKDGYTIIHKGYSTIRDISSGNFKVHKNFLDALLEVSPAVRNYKRIADIINIQFQIVKRSKSALKQFKEDNSFTPGEVVYLEKVYSNLFNESLRNLDELAMVITAGKLRMSDDERLRAIDQIYAKIEEQFLFLQDFNTSTSYLSLQRRSEKAEVEMSRRLRGY